MPARPGAGPRARTAKRKNQMEIREKSGLRILMPLTPSWRILEKVDGTIILLRQQRRNFGFTSESKIIRLAQHVNSLPRSAEGSWASVAATGSGGWMRTGFAVVSGLALLLSVYAVSPASKLPASPATPTGCASSTFDIGIEVSREWGVVPFRSTFSITTIGGGDTVETVHWTFGADDPLGAVGTTVSQVFTEPIDYLVTARAVTAAHGVITKQVTVSGHSAVMTITFDDGHRTVLTHALPLLESYCVTATAYIVPAWTTLDPVVYMTWDDIAVLQDAGWDIGSHGMTHHKLTELDPFDLEWEVGQSQAVLQSRGFPARTFSLPNESYNDAVMEVVREYYESCKTDRGINPGINDADPYMIQSQLTLSWRPFEYYQAHIDSVLATGGWYVLNNHIVRDDCGGANWCVRTDQLAEVMDYALANRLKIASVDEVMRNRVLGESMGEDGLQAAGPSGQAVQVLGASPVMSGEPADIRFQVPVSGGVDIGVYDVTGRRIRSMFYSAQNAGEHRITWDGKNSSGNRVASGHYFVVFSIEGNVGTAARVLVLR